MPSTVRKSQVHAYGALAAAGCLWGTGFFFGKMALQELDVPHMILYRLLFACAGFIPVMLARGIVHRRQDRPTLLLAATLGVPCLFLIQFEGLARTTVAHASLMVGTAPILVGIGAAWLGRERVDARRYVLLAASTAGALLILLGAGKSDGPSAPSVVGDTLVLASLLAGVAWIFASKRLMERYDSGAVTATVMVTGTALLAAWVLVVEGAPPTDLSLRAWSALAAQGLLATTVATLLWNWGVARVPTSQAGVFLNFEPVVGALLGVLLLDEVLGWTGLLGGTLIIVAAVAVAKPPAASAAGGRAGRRQQD